DLEMPADAQTVAIVRKNFVVLWAPSGLADKSSKGKPAPKIKEIADLAGHRVGMIGRTPANAALLRVILSASGVEADKVAETQFGTTKSGSWRGARPPVHSWRAVRSPGKSPRTPSARRAGREASRKFSRLRHRTPSPW